MPLVSVKTNLSREKVPEGINAAMTQIVSKNLQKPSAMIFVEIDSGCQMTLDANFDPMAIIKIECVGRLKPKTNLALANELELYFEENLRIPKNRMVFRFESPKALFVAYNGSLLDPKLEFDEDLD